MTDGISINQFRAQAQQGQPLDAKVKLGGEDGLKTYGNNFLGKIACWFQKSSTRKTQSQDIRNSFIESIQREYGRDSVVDDLTNRLSGNKRLSVRTIQTTLETLDTNRSRMTDIFVELGEKLGFTPPMKEEGGLDMEQLGQLRQEISEDILRMKRNSPNFTEDQAQNIARSKIEKYIVENISINSTEDAVKFLGNISATNTKVAVQKAFDQLIQKQGGLDMLRNASKQLLRGELSTANPTTYIRGNSAPILMTTKILAHMTQETNQTLIENVQGAYPEDFPEPLVDGEPNPKYETATLELAKNCFEKIQNTWAKNMSTETKEFLKEIRDLSKEFEGNLGDQPGYKIASHFTGLRILNPLLATEVPRLAKEAIALTKSGDQTEAKRSQSMSRAMLDVAKGMQTLFNSAHLDSPDNVINSMGDRSKYLRPFIENETNRMAMQVMVNVLSSPV